MVRESSEMPQGTLSLLDAGVFGSSEDSDPLNSIRHAKEMKTQRQIQYRSDHWHSAPWKKTMEVPLVVPPNSSHVKILSAYAVDKLWTPQTICSHSSRIHVPKDFECNDISDDDLEGESKRIYSQVIFDLTRELLHAECQGTANPNPCPWLQENVGPRCSRHIRTKTDVSEVKIQELHKEEGQWTDYAEDELTVKRRVTEDIFDSLVLDTIGVLKKISLQRTCD
nr:centrosome-associated protein 350-like isoform X3 [Pelodiscus sinensis]|eukprot:XP_006120858.1 centrosome-associated protein 350-like isoform X3 [Pelodiscus sinensis]